MDATDSNRKREPFYGYIEEIRELEYGPNFKVPLFRCQWVKLTGVTKDQYGLIIVDLNNLGYRDESFVLAKMFLRFSTLRTCLASQKRGSTSKPMSQSDT